MSEIKLKIWDKRDKQMWLCSVEDLMRGEYPSDFHVCEPNAEFDATAPIRKDLVFRRYTGLRDKNGLEIYEGDILRFNWVDSAGYCQVVFENASFGLYWINTSVKEDEGFKSFWSHEENDFCWNLEWVEIIGNIYENPELLSR